jgi:maltose/moltooligosaccharide transporter
MRIRSKRSTRKTSLNKTDPSSTELKRSWTVGTLLYNRASLFAVCFWLLWGDFALQFMAQVVPKVMPLKLKELNASDALIGILVTSLMWGFALVVTPTVSYWSDRYRGRAGRRIPFLLWPTPFLTLFLVLIAYFDAIALWLQTLIPGSMSDTGAALLVLSVCLFGFHLFHVIIQSVYYYLFNDVVPQEVIGRFLSIFRLVSIAAVALFDFVVLEHAQSHFRQIFLGAALLYCIAFLTMSWRVKEGSYPPPSATVDGNQGLMSNIRTFFAECYSHPFFWYYYLFCGAITLGQTVVPFITILQFGVGVDGAWVAKLIGASSIVSALLMYPMGVLVDRFHPIRVMIVAVAGSVVASLLAIPFIVGIDDPKKAFWALAMLTLVLLPFRALFEAAGMPLHMRLLPKTKYGQFCSAIALVNAAAGLIGGYLAGATLGWIKSAMKLPDESTRHYAWAPILLGAANLLALIFLLAAYRWWKKLGGETEYSPPEVQLNVQTKVTP